MRQVIWTDEAISMYELRVHKHLHRTLAEQVEDAMETFRRRAQPVRPLDPPILGMPSLPCKPTTIFGAPHAS